MSVLQREDVMYSQVVLLLLCFPTYSSGRMGSGNRNGTEILHPGAMTNELIIRHHIIPYIPSSKHNPRIRNVFTAT